ncbi:hypothetical protein PoB_005608900 [Plakobranchus ocellatus]|uniref:Uncharacterized protein n=1 Tax=Plakobranchus ocellatus TaxID=259542 RepID=A0AAV4CAJ6_9GAST|nr:hypothetical protein PoB_005608900 [Plakobranchus ocellatus]
MPMEVGASGFAGTSAYNLLSKLSINGQRRTKALKVLAELPKIALDRFGAEGMSSYFISNWFPPTIGGIFGTIGGAFDKKKSPQFGKKKL